MTNAMRFESPLAVMRHAANLAERGLGRVEPNPAVGAVLVDSGLNLLGAGYHERFGGPHAEVNALADFEERTPDAAFREQLLADATMYVTLEPCCHQGKTPPCSQALIDAGVQQVVTGLRDPSPHVDGGGITQLEHSGIRVTTGLGEEFIRQLNAPFLKLITEGLPWVHAKWAMTLDGKIATRTGASKWISSDPSRQRVHMLRGRMDAIIVGAGTARADDPLLTVRVPGPRTPSRIVVDSNASLPLDSQLVRTVDEAPVIVAANSSAPTETLARLRSLGVEVLQCDSESPRVEIRDVLLELARRNMTNVLIEGGGELLGSAFDQQLIDELHVFVAPKLAGGSDATSPIAGQGLELIPESAQLHARSVEQVGDDVYIRGRLR